MREICLDIETTGLEPREGHKIVEIACVELFNKIKTGKVFHTYVNPRRDMPDGAFKIHGISAEFLQDKPIFAHVAQKFLEFINDSKLVIHNASFDTKFLNHELRILNLPSLEKFEICDSLSLARKKFPGSPNSLDALCKRFKIDLSQRKKHGALTDTELLCEVYIELTGGMQTGMTFESGQNDTIKSPRNASDSRLKTSKRENHRNLQQRKFSATEDDLEKHQKFILNNFKSNFWGI